MLTPEEVKALADGLTRKKAANEKPVTRETFLNWYRSCSNCKFDGSCRRQNFGYYRPDADSYYVSSVYPLGYKSCCVFNANAAVTVYNLLQQAEREGKICR